MLTLLSEGRRFWVILFTLVWIVLFIAEIPVVQGAEAAKDASPPPSAETLQPTSVEQINQSVSRLTDKETRLILIQELEKAIPPAEVKEPGWMERLQNFSLFLRDACHGYRSPPSPLFCRNRSGYRKTDGWAECWTVDAASGVNHRTFPCGRMGLVAIQRRHTGSLRCRPGHAGLEAVHHRSAEITAGIPGNRHFFPRGGAPLCLCADAFLRFAGRENPFRLSDAGDCPGTAFKSAVTSHLGPENRLTCVSCR